MFLAVLLSVSGLSQNAGIGTATLLRVKLEVHGVAGTGAASAI